MVLEIKSGKIVHDNDLRSLKALKEDGKAGHFLVVRQEKYPRELDGIKILPWITFLEI